MLNMPENSGPLYTKTFDIDVNSSDEQYLYVDVAGRGTVVIKAEDEGIVIDIYPFHVVDEPVASTWVDMSDLMIF